MNAPRHAVEIGWHVGTVGLCHALGRKSRLPLGAIAIIDVVMVVALGWHLAANWADLTSPRWLPAR